MTKADKMTKEVVDISGKTTNSNTLRPRSRQNQPGSNARRMAKGVVLDGTRQAFCGTLTVGCHPSELNDYMAHYSRAEHCLLTRTPNRPHLAGHIRKTLINLANKTGVNARAIKAEHDLGPGQGDIYLAQVKEQVHDGFSRDEPRRRTWHVLLLPPLLPLLVLIHILVLVVVIVIDGKRRG